MFQVAVLSKQGLIHESHTNRKRKTDICTLCADVGLDEEVKESLNCDELAPVIAAICYPLISFFLVLVLLSMVHSSTESGDHLYSLA
jgi:hypothetical protein